MAALNVRLVNAIVARLAAINGVAPYETDVDARIYKARRTLDPVDLPCVIVWEGEEEATNSAGGSANGSTQSLKVALTVRVDGLVAADATNTGDELAKIKSDIKRAVLSFADPAITDGEGRIAQGGIEYLGATPLPREDGANVEGVQCTFRVNLLEGYGNPNAPI